MDEQTFTPNDINTPNGFEELDDMRRQIALLKQKLDDEQIVSGRLMRQTLRQQKSVFARQEMTEYLAVLFCFISFPVVFPTIGFSWWFCGFALLMVLFSGIMTAIQHRHVRGTNFLTADLLTVANNVKELKQSYLDWLKWGVLLICVFFGWLLGECFLRIKDPKMAACIAIGSCLGLGIGLIISISMYRKVIHTCDDIIRQIEGI